MMRATAIAVSILSLTCLTARSDQADDVAQLEQAGYETTNAALCQILEALRPTAELQRRIDEAIAELGHRSYRVRVAAVESLKRIGAPARASMLALADATDLEVRLRANEVIEYLAGDNHTTMIKLAIRVLAARRAGEAFEPLLTAIEHAPDATITATAEAALSQLLGDTHGARLRELLMAEHPLTLRVSAARLLGKLGAAADRELLQRMLAGPPSLQLAACESLARLGDHAALPPLVALLGHEQLEIRMHAAKLLRRATGQNHAFIAYGTAEQRAAAIARWHAWVEGPGREAALIRDLAADSTTHLGRIAYCMITTERQVVELDSEGKVAWRRPVGQPWDIEIGADGARLVLDIQQRQLVEFDASGTERWRVDEIVAGCMSVARLPNGNLVLANPSQSRLIIFDIKRKLEIASIAIADRPTDVQALSDERFLIVTQTGQAQEIDRTGQVHWRHAGLSRPMSARRLENGNTLIAEMGKNRVVEVDPHGKEAWTSGSIVYPYDAVRLPNGTTLVAGRTGLVEIGADGKLLREIVKGFVVRVFSW